MLNISKTYRHSYVNEDIISQRVYEGGVWNNTIETINNSVINNQISNQAVVFGNGITRNDFDCKLVINHLGGVLAQHSLQTYGCNAIYRDFKVDFLVAPERLMAKEISDHGYCIHNIVYTRILNTIEFPQKFYLIPNDLYADAGTTAVYIAAFDGHKKIFLLGFDGQDTEGFNNNIYAGTNAYDPINTEVRYNDKIWKDNLKSVFSVYDDVDFVWVTVGGKSTMYQEWQYLPNVRQISFRDFVLEASL